MQELIESFKLLGLRISKREADEMMKVGGGVVVPRNLGLGWFLLAHTRAYVLLPLHFPLSPSLFLNS